MLVITLLIIVWAKPLQSVDLLFLHCLTIDQTRLNPILETLWLYNFHWCH